MQKLNQKLNFKTQNLKIDFITLTVPHFDDLSTGNYRKIVERLFQDLSTKDTT